jgi:hypothetical protein
MQEDNGPERDEWRFKHGVRDIIVRAHGNGQISRSAATEAYYNWTPGQTFSHLDDGTTVEVIEVTK